MIGIVDCDNFYASCERVFNPSLRGKPIVVLSNNDGCIIARSNEAKALGIKMGTPFYQAKDMLQKNGVATFSSNYNLYGDMSRRVMSLLLELTPGITQYSIDECFVDFSGVPSLEALAKDIVKKITQGTGIPITIGIAETKTLAKVASKYGKKYKGYHGVCIIDTEEKRIKALKGLEVGSIWGIGRRNAEKLRAKGVLSALDLTLKSEAWVRRELTVTGVRTWMELNSQNAINIDELPQKKSITSSRSFSSQGLNSKDALEEAIANFAAIATSKLRKQHSCCKAITVFAHTSRFIVDKPFVALNKSASFPVATSNLNEIVSLATRIFSLGYREGFFYKKAGVILWDICDEKSVEGDLFDSVDRPRLQRLSKAIDKLNLNLGRDVIHMAVQGKDKGFHLKSDYISKQYTTNINDILQIKT